MRSIIFGIIALFVFETRAFAQDLTVSTVTRPPFSMLENGQSTGFTMDLWAAMMDDIGRDYTVRRVDSFSEMLKMVEDGEVDAAAANISITSERERIMDFSHPIFASGLQIMTPAGAGQISLWSAVFSYDLLLAIVGFFILLFLSGMFMWFFERDKQPYFELSARKAMFPAFWWALNLVVNGGFEERQPRSTVGRFFGVILVISSLFLVSIFVAKITASLTVDAIQNSVSGINDLHGKRVGTIDQSTSARYLQNREVRYLAYTDLNSLTNAFENDQLDAVVFDAPILAYYVNTKGKEIGELVGPVFIPENYGIALPTDSVLTEQLNQSLLRLRENGTYESIYQKWFGQSL